MNPKVGVIMGRRVKDSYEIQRILDKAKKREQYREQHRINNPKPYKKRADFRPVYYRDIVDNEKIIKLQASEAAIQKIGDLATVGLLNALPAGKEPISVRGLNYPIVKIMWFYGDDNPVASTTPWGTRVIRYHDKDGAQSHYSIPISSTKVPFGIDDLVSEFQSLFNPNNGTKRALLGARGQAKLVLGRSTILTL
ncbi:hypothetical protein BZZ01_32460 [Nostocales cyanobacterium HT-58-2]|nr:hypothetical protein BZZ01_32460 [Nostocales cyanobacterium HT-58-2]